MAEKPLISVCVPLFNKAVDVERCLRTIMTCKQERLEIVIFDNGSTDGSTEIVSRLAAEDSRLRHIRLEHTVMIQESWRMALLHAHGEFLKLHSADDELHPDFFREMLPPLLASPDLDFSMCAEEVRKDPSLNYDAAPMTRFFHETNANCQRLLAIPERKDRIRQLALLCSAHNRLGNLFKILMHNRCLPRERWRLVTHASPMPTSYPDWDFLIRLLLNHRGTYVDHPLSSYHIRANSPIMTLPQNSTAQIGEAYQFLLMVLTALADPTLVELRRALSPQELQELFQLTGQRTADLVNRAIQPK